MKVHGKHIIVTGGGNGIGRTLALELLQKDAHVLAVDLSESALQETRGMAGSKQQNLSTFVLDITDKIAVEQFVQEHISNRPIDGIINNAGIIQPFVRLKDLSYDKIQRVMDVNFYGTLYLITSLLPHLLSRPEAHIVNVSSMGGFMPFPGQTIYGASKAAVKLLTEGLNSELRDTKVRVTIFFPGAIDTNIAANSGIEMKMVSNKNSKMKTTSAKDAAKIIINGMEKDAYRILVGTDAKLMDILYRIAPSFAAKFIYKKMRSLLPK